MILKTTSITFCNMFQSNKKKNGNNDPGIIFSVYFPQPLDYEHWQQ